MRHMTVLAWTLSLVSSLHAAADWPSWRGPLQNGAANNVGSIADSLPTNDWKGVWESEPVPGDTDGGFGSPVVADGRVYLFCAWRTWSNLTERCLPAKKAAELGLAPANIDDGVLAEIEAARVSPERKAAQGQDVEKWSQAWVAAHPDVTQQVAVARFAEDRIKRGENAFPIEGLRTITQIVDRVFVNQDALLAWFKDNAITSPFREQIEQRIPKKTPHIDDVTICLDAASGRTIWKKTFPGQTSDWGSSSTPCIAGGIAFVMGSAGTAYAFDALNGNLVWTNALARQPVSASFACSGDKLFVQAGQLMALDRTTGKTIWIQKAAGGVYASPVIWEHAGKTYVLAGGSHVVCVDAEDGHAMWNVPGGDNSTPALSGDSMAVQYGAGMAVYSLSATGAVKVADIKSAGSRGSSAAVSGGKAYTTSEGRAVCVDMKTGAVIWDVPGTREQFASPILVSEKLLALGAGGKVFLFNAADGKLLGSTKVGALRCTSPALAGTRLFVRTTKGVSCYEFGE